MSGLRYFAIYKPYGMLSQFTKEGGRAVLGELFDFPSDVYPVGRLDADSEGLLLLTNDAKLNARLLHPKQRHEREYWVQVEGLVTERAIEKLSAGGLVLKLKKKSHRCLPAKAEVLSPPALPEREPPIRYRKNVPTSWLSLALVEGKNRQVRKMTAAVGFPTLRLVRSRIAGLTLGQMQVGQVNELSQNVVYQALFGR